MKSHQPPSRPEARRPRPSQAQILLHQLNNNLAALRLRLDLVTRDTTCMWAQEPNLRAMIQLLEEARQMAGRLEDEAWATLPRARTGR